MDRLPVNCLTLGGCLGTNRHSQCSPVGVHVLSFIMTCVWQPCYCYFSLVDSCFTMCYFLLLNNVNQPCVYMCLLPLEAPTHPRPIPLGHHERRAEVLVLCPSQLPTELSPLHVVLYVDGLPWWPGRERICLQCGRCGLDPWVGKMPWRRAWQPTPVFLLGKSYGQRSLAGLQSMGVAKSQTRLSD